MAYSVVQKHIKRQIISLDGGFKVIADLNAYHTFISSLRVPQITADFSHLKMLGHVFIVSDAKDLASIVKDVARYGGSYRPEVRLLVLSSFSPFICADFVPSYVGYIRIYPASKRLEKD